MFDYLTSLNGTQTPTRADFNGHSNPNGHSNGQHTAVLDTANHAGYLYSNGSNGGSEPSNPEVELIREFKYCPKAAKAVCLQRDPLSRPDFSGQVPGYIYGLYAVTVRTSGSPSDAAVLALIEADLKSDESVYLAAQAKPFFAELAPPAERPEQDTVQRALILAFRIKQAAESDRLSHPKSHQSHETSGESHSKSHETGETSHQSHGKSHETSETSHQSHGKSHETSETSRKNRFTLLHADELDNQPPPTFIYTNEVPANGFAVVFGPSGAGKSFITIDYALTVAQSANVVYVVAEGGTGFSIRKRAWCKFHDKSSGGLHVITQAVPLLDPRAVREFVETVQHLQPALIVFDTLARCMSGGDENSAKDMGLFIEACNYIQQETGATVMPVHHTGKSGTVERGSSALRGAADAMIEIANDDGLITLSCSKSKDALPFSPRYLRLTQVDLGQQQADGEPLTSCVPLPASKVSTEGAPLTDSQRKVLALLDLEIFSEAGAKGIDLKESVPNLSRPSFFRLLAALKRKRYIAQHHKGDPYFITDAGRKILAGVEIEGGLESQVSHVSSKSHETHETSPIPEVSSLTSLTTPLGVRLVRLETGRVGYGLETKRKTANDAEFEPYTLASSPPSPDIPGVQSGMPDADDPDPFDLPMEGPEDQLNLEPMS